MSGDSRKDFVLATTANYFAVQVTDGSIQSLLNSPALNSFLDDGNATVLAGRFDVKGGRAKGFTFSNKVSTIDFFYQIQYNVNPSPAEPRYTLPLQTV